MKPITVAIDGPAASGKSTTAAAVARRLGYCHVNSGALYRAITWAALRGNWIDDEEHFAGSLHELDLQLVRDPPSLRVRVAGREPGAELVGPETSARVSEVSARPEVRDKVLGILRAAGREGGVVCDGRDIGTVVFPDAELKVFLVASAQERGRRRLKELGAVADRESVAAEASRLVARDEADSTRDLSPLRRAPDALEIDTTSLEPAEVVEAIVRLAHQRGARGGVG